MPTPAEILVAITVYTIIDLIVSSSSQDSTLIIRSFTLQRPLHRCVPTLTLMAHAPAINCERFLPIPLFPGPFYGHITCTHYCLPQVVKTVICVLGVSFCLEVAVKPRIIVRKSMRLLSRECGVVTLSNHALSTLETRSPRQPSRQTYQAMQLMKHGDAVPINTTLGWYSRLQSSRCSVRNQNKASPVCRQSVTIELHFGPQMTHPASMNPTLDRKRRMASNRTEDLTQMKPSRDVLSTGQPP